ncbi:hypothetical protein [Persephonella sp. KM09-Lau-8]|uniref:hypothetical protein n=1 Tax=Persephonella sp. KM09-Lau-8 TaxID=1158345 RepID=UPI0004972E39|nr:hypothetical protein [Persephonella sp. KM09-Lau-8]
MKKEKLLEIAKRHFPEYKILDIHYPENPLQPPEYMVVEFEMPEDMKIKDYLKFYSEIEKHTLFYPVFAVSFQFGDENDTIPQDSRRIAVWTRNKEFLKEFYACLENT